MEQDPLLLQPAPDTTGTTRNRTSRFAITIASIIAGLVLVVGIASMPPHDFPMGGVINVPKNASISDVAQSLHTHALVRSEIMFKIASILIGGRMGVMSGDYLFSLPTNVWQVAYRINHGEQGLARARVTFPEGATSYEMADIISEAIPGFDVSGFLSLATSTEGYLFPDTYYFFSNAKPEDVIKVVSAEFTQKYRQLISETDIQMSPFLSKPLHDVVTMASIVEKEAINDTDRKIVAGILWKRLEKNMPLQVDPPFQYFLGKASHELTLADLKVNSPYNTYVNKGLPAGPIGNPGVEALRATMVPTSTPYLFYLSDKTGMMHYARTYDEHLANKAKYIDK